MTLPSPALLLQRSPVKITFPEIWANTCCSHPLFDLPEETILADGLGVKVRDQCVLFREDTDGLGGKSEQWGRPCDANEAHARHRVPRGRIELGAFTSCFDYVLLEARRACTL